MTWWRRPSPWWRDPALKADDDDDTGAIIPPGRGDFEQIIQDRLEPVFDAARERALVALTEGDQFDEAGLRDELIALFLPVLTDAVIFATNEIEGQFALGFDEADVQAEARAWAKERAGVLADQLIATTQDLLSELEPEEVESSLERAFGAARRLTIGQSETTDAMSAGGFLFQRLARALEIFVDLIWYTRDDEKVCFPKGIKVITRQGEKPIELVSVGDVVRTQAGWNRVTATHKTPYSGDFVSFWAGGNLVTCTEDHPIFVLEKGWLEANKLNISDRVQLSNDEVGNVTRVVNFSFSDPDDLPAKLGEIFGLSAIPFRILMPIFSINLKRNLVGGNEKVNAVAPHSTLLNKIYIKLRNSPSDFGLKQCFARVFAIAGERAKLSIRVRRNAPKFLTTSLALDNAWRPPALLGAETRRPSRLAALKLLVTPLASKRLDIDRSAFPATDRISVCDAGVDFKLLRADRANLPSLLGRHIGLPARGGTEAFPPLNPTALEVPPLPALRTGDGFASARGRMIAFCGAVGSFPSNFSWSLKRFFATLARIRIHSVHLLINLRLLYHGLCGSASVYNLSVENDPTFYASNVLVHNCEICEPLHNKGQAVWSVKFPTGPKAHPKCRCGLWAERRRRMWRRPDSELKGALGKLRTAIKKKKGKKGPGRGWWGPDKGGTHGKKTVKKKGGTAGSKPAKKKSGAAGGEQSLEEKRRMLHDERAGMATDHGRIKISGSATGGSSRSDERAIDVHGRPPKGEWDFTYEESDKNQARAAAKLSDETGINEGAIGRMLDRWSGTSNDNNYAALHTQEMASELFNVEMSPWQKKRLAGALEKRMKNPDAYHSLLEFERPTKNPTDVGARIGKYIPGVPHDNHNDATKAVLRAMHKETQREFKQAGYAPGDTVTIYRGVGQNAAARGGKRGKLGGTQEYRANALESWSLDRNIAQVFSNDNDGQVFSAKIPVERILSMSHTGFGKLKEWEVVVIAGQEPDEYRVVYDEFGARWWEE